MLRRASVGFAYFVNVAEEIDLAPLRSILEGMGYAPAEKARRRIPPTILVHPPLYAFREDEPSFQLRAYPFGIVEILFWQDLPLDLREIHEALLQDAPHEIYAKVEHEFHRLLPSITPAMEGKGTHDEERYRMILLVPAAPLDTQTLWETLPLVPWLLGEDEVFSPQIIRDLQSRALSYTAYDLLLIGWDRSILVDPWEETEVFQLIEMALAQDLEWSSLDVYLESEMEGVYTLLSEKRPINRRRLKEIQKLQLDFLEALDRVQGGIKLTEDPYFARIYNQALRTFGVPDTRSSIQARLEYIERLWLALANEQRDQRMEFVEWGIFFLILLEILIWLISSKG